MRAKSPIASRRIPVRHRRVFATAVVGYGRPDRNAPPISPQRRRLAIAIGIAGVLGAGRALARWEAIDAPNLVPISATLATSGQPSAAALASLKQAGVEAVVYLGPRGGRDLVPDEPSLLRSQGIEFIHVPFPPDGPHEAQYHAVADALRRLRGRRTLVHCQVNWQASTFVFLHRVIVDKEQADLAYDAVARVWSPSGPWKEMLVTQLRKHGVGFDPY